MLISKLRKNKRAKLRNAEYYDMTNVFDKLYENSSKGKTFNELMKYIACEDNIKLAYRNIKRNHGSKTAGVDKRTISDIERMAEDDFVSLIKRKFDWYKPKPVKRVDIPKSNGKLRPLGIPAITDRIVQQCILQVLEPICEGKFHDNSYGFRQNRSVEHALANCYRIMQRQKLHYVVDVDIKGFFDNVDHAKLMKQIWALGIRDKKLLSIVIAMLKAPIKMPDSSIDYPTKGIPQGGILSPLLANIVLNEMDWWVDSQWANIPTRHKFLYDNGKGVNNKCKKYAALRKTRLKEMYIVRYADDFKIFCNSYSDAIKVRYAVTAWLRERLNLEVNEDKTKVVNLKTNYSDFLGFKMKVIPKGKSFVVKSRMSDKALKAESEKLITQIKKVQKPSDNEELGRGITYYNAMVMGMHNYYRYATCISMDADIMGRRCFLAWRNRLGDRISKSGHIDNPYIKARYGASKQIRFAGCKPIVPIGYVRTVHPLCKKRDVNSFTREGRMHIHKELNIDLTIIRMMSSNKIGYSIEYMDNRISLYCAQHGKCAITGICLSMDNLHCHHIKPRQLGGNDRYDNLIIVHSDIHKLIHAVNEDVINRYRNRFEFTLPMLKKINKLRNSLELKELALS